MEGEFHRALALADMGQQEAMAKPHSGVSYAIQLQGNAEGRNKEVGEFIVDFVAYMRVCSILRLCYAGCFLATTYLTWLTKLNIFYVYMCGFLVGKNQPNLARKAQSS